MNYYRKAAAIFILFFSLMLPLFLEAEEKVAVVEINTLIRESQTLSLIEKSGSDQEAAEGEIMQLIKDSASEFAENNRYSSVITKHGLYKGGEDITGELAEKIDGEN